jgi:hypothetical protein
MDTLAAAIQKLKDAGLSPTVQVSVRLSNNELDELKEIRSRLAKQGITSQVQLIVSLAEQPAGPGVGPGEEQPPVVPGTQEPIVKEASW